MFCPRKIKFLSNSQGAIARQIVRKRGRQTIPEEPTTTTTTTKQVTHKWGRRSSDIRFSLFPKLFFWRDVWPIRTRDYTARSHTLILSVCPIRNDRIPDAHSSPQQHGPTEFPPLGALSFPILASDGGGGVGGPPKPNTSPPHTHTTHTHKTL